MEQPTLEDATAELEQRQQLHAQLTQQLAENQQRAIWLQGYIAGSAPRPVLAEA